MGKVRHRDSGDATMTTAHFSKASSIGKSTKIRLAMDDYVETLNSWGETILVWADPENKFRGYTEVRKSYRLQAGSGKRNRFFMG